LPSSKASADFKKEIAEDFGDKPFIIQCRNCTIRCNFKKPEKGASYQEILARFHEHFTVGGLGKPSDALAVVQGSSLYVMMRDA